MARSLSFKESVTQEHWLPVSNSILTSWEIALSLLVAIALAICKSTTFLVFRTLTLLWVWLSTAVSPKDSFALCSMLTRASWSDWWCPRWQKRQPLCRSQSFALWFNLRQLKHRPAQINISFLSLTSFTELSSVYHDSIHIVHLEYWWSRS